MRLTTFTAVDVDLRAFHTDPHGGEGRHEHTWNVRLVFDGVPFRDGRKLRDSLGNVLKPYQGRDLPWWSGEEIARSVLMLGDDDALGCIVTRPGFHAEAWRR